MRRWLLRFTLGIIVLIGLVVLTVHIVLRTDVPRRLVLSALHENTGLRFEAASLTTGWRGQTELRDLSVALPLERDPFLSIPSLRITHTDLLRLAIFRSIDIDEAVVDRAHAVLRQDAAGAWNVARAAAIIDNVQVQRAAGREAPARPINLPALSLRDARIDIHPGLPGRPDPQVITYAPLSIEGRANAPLAWEFEVMLEGERVAAGHLSPRGRWPHRLEITIDKAAPHVEPWRAEFAAAEPHDDADIPEVPSDLAVAAVWEGRLTEDGITGRLTMERLIAAGMRAHGEATVTATAPAATFVVEPHDLRLDGVHPEIESIRLMSGRIVYEGSMDRARLSRVIIEAHGSEGALAAQVDGEWAGAEERGAASVQWSGRFDTWLAQHEGTLQLAFTTPRIGRQTLDATVVTQGTVPQGAWDVDLRVSGHGRTWADFAGRISAPRLDVITLDNEYDFGGFAARFARDESEIVLSHINLPSAPPTAGVTPPTFRGQGRFNTETLAWAADLAAANWIPPARLPQFEPEPLEFRMIVRGMPGGREVQLESLHVSSRHGNYMLSGHYSADEPQAPVLARLVFEVDVPDTGEALAGKAHGEMNLFGVIEPLRVHLEGTVHGQDLTWEDRPMQQVMLRLRGELDDSRASFESDGFELFGGTWHMSGNYDRAANDTRLALQGADAQVDQLISVFAGPPGIGGSISMDVEVTVPDLNFAQAELAGTWAARDLHAHQLHATTGRGMVQAVGDRAFLTELVLEHDGGTLRGSAELNLKNLRSLTVDVTTEQWPITIAAIELDARTNGEAALHVDLVDMTAIGDVSIAGAAAFRNEPIGDFELNAGVLGRTVTLQSMTASVFDGEGSGSGTIFLEPDRWMESTVDFAWSDVDISQLADLSDQFKDFRGRSSGWFSARRSDEEPGRAPEPIRIDAATTLSDAHYGPLGIETATLEGYLGPGRLMIQRASAAIAGGEINFWGRLTRHEGAPFAHLHATLDELDLQQLADFMEFTGAGNGQREMPGRISGWASAGGYLVQPRTESVTTLEGDEVEIVTGPRLFGQCQMSITESDLVALPGFATLYDLLRIDFGGLEPTGRGEATIRLENNALEISRLTYFNRGTDVVARLRMENIWRGADSPINGIAAGVVRPLRDLDLPLVGRLDRLIGAIQADAASVRIGGRFAEPEAVVVPFADVTSAVSRILRGRVSD